MLTDAERRALLQAAEICERSWAQGPEANRSTGYCVGQAICVSAAAQGLSAADMYVWFLIYLGTELLKWNDDPARTKDEVVATLRAAANG